MSAALKLTAEQVRALSPVLAMRGSAVLVANIFPDGDGWTLAVHALPGERRDAIRAACAGELKIPRRRGRAAFRASDSRI